MLEVKLALSQLQKQFSLHHHYRKHATINYLNVNIAPQFQIGLFEATIWQTAADTSFTHQFSWHYFHPVMGIRPLQHGLNGRHNVLLGLNISWNFFNYWQAYGQLLLDNMAWDKRQQGKEHAENKTGAQLGLSCFDLFHGKARQHKLYVQGEYNRVRPYSYSHQLPLQAYTHYNQELAHPLGANFHESIFRLRYRWKHWQLYAQYNYALTGKDSSSIHYGSNIFLPTDLTNNNLPSVFNNEIGQGTKTQLEHQILEISYQINPRTNMQLFARYHRRLQHSNGTSHETELIMLGFRTALRNLYQDF